MDFCSFVTIRFRKTRIVLDVDTKNWKHVENTDLVLQMVDTLIMVLDTHMDQAPMALWTFSYSWFQISELQNTSKGKISITRNPRDCWTSALRFWWFYKNLYIYINMEVQFLVRLIVSIHWMSLSSIRAPRTFIMHLGQLLSVNLGRAMLPVIHCNLLWNFRRFTVARKRAKEPPDKACQEFGRNQSNQACQSIVSPIATTLDSLDH